MDYVYVFKMKETRPCVDGAISWLDSNGKKYIFIGESGTCPGK
jgi:hypothetical protein